RPPRAPSQGRSVHRAGTLEADLPLAHVAGDERGVPLGRRAVAAPAAGAHADYVARLHLHRRLRGQARLDAAADEHVLGDAPLAAAEGAPRAAAVAVGEDRVRRRAVEHVVLAQAEAAAVASGALRVGP